MEQDAESWFEQGNQQLMAGDFEGAIASYDQAIHLKPEFSEAWYNRGIALGNLGRHEEAIAVALNLPIKQVYRLREKISYHATRVFAVKSQPDLVSSWLGASIEQNLGLAPQEWQLFWDGLTINQKQLVEDMKSKKTPEAIATERNLKVSQVVGEWTKLYLAAHTLRTGSKSSRTESGGGR